MEFNHSITIDKPRDVVVKYFKDPKYLKEYQEGFVKKELMSGSEGEDGSKSKFFYKNGKHEIELIETIVKNNLPASFEANYHHIHMDNVLKSSFHIIDDNKTRYSIEGKYSRIDWFMPKLIAILLPSMYKKPPQKWMLNFKNFVERQE